MHPIIYLNKTMVEAAKARVAPVSSAMLYGRGVFTTVAIHEGTSLFWPTHWDRLQQNSTKLGINIRGLSEQVVGEALQKLLAVNEVRNGRARVILLARSGPEFWKTQRTEGRETDLVIMTNDPQKISKTGLTIAVSPYRVNTLSPLAGMKTLNYLDHVLSWEEAQTRQFDEAVTLNERGEVVSATMANLFWVKEGSIHTPTMSTGAYAGVTREVVLEIANKQFIPVLEGVYELGDLTEAEEIFVTSASLGVAIVTTFDFRQYAVTPESVAERIRNGYQALIKQNSNVH